MVGGGIWGVGHVAGEGLCKREAPSAYANDAEEEQVLADTTPEGGVEGMGGDAPASAGGWVVLEVGVQCCITTSTHDIYLLQQQELGDRSTSCNSTAKLLCFFYHNEGTYTSTGVMPTWKLQLSDCKIYLEL